MRMRSWSGEDKNQKSLIKRGHILRINRNEALLLIEGLSKQLRTNDCNVGPREFYMRDGAYFTIFVNDKLEMEE